MSLEYLSTSFLGRIAPTFSLTLMHSYGTDEKGLIGGLTETFCNKLQLDSSLLADKALHLHNICPEVADISASNQKYELQLNFIIPHNFAAQEFFVQTRRQRELHPSRGNERRTGIFDAASFSAKCEVEPINYPGGVNLKCFRVLQLCRSNELWRKRTLTQIPLDVMSSTQTILRAVRKFKQLAIFALRKDPLNSPSDNGSPKDRLRLEKQGQARGKQTPPHSRYTSRSRSRIRVRVRNRSSNTSLSHVVHNLEFNKFSEGGSLLAQLAGNSPRTLNQKHIEEEEKEKEQPIGSEPSERQSTSAPMLRPSQGVSPSISQLRKKQASASATLSVQCLNFTTHMLTCSVALAFLLRLIVALWLNGVVASLMPLMRANGDRHESMGLMGRAIESLVLLYPIVGVDFPPTDVALRENRYNYSEMLKQYGVYRSSTSYKEFAKEQLQFSIRTVRKAQTFITSNIGLFEKSVQALANPSAIEMLSAWKEGTTRSYMMSIEAVVNMMAGLTHQLMEDMEQGRYVSFDNTTATLLRNIMGPVTVVLRGCMDILVNEGNQQVKLQEDYSSAIMYSLLVLYVVYFLILIPFLVKSSQEIENILLLFLEISQKDLREQNNRAQRFLFKLLSSIRMKETMELEAEANRNFDPEEEEADPFPEPENAPMKPTQKQSRHRIFVRYSSRVWTILLLFIGFSGLEFSIYYFLDSIAQQTCTRLAFKITELRRLSRGIYANLYNVPYLYHLILTNKTGDCAQYTCVKYLNLYFSLRMTEVNEVLTSHQSGAHLLSAEDNRLFSNLFEHNPCGIPSLSSIRNCTTMAGGTFTQGGYAANIKFLDVSYSIYKDFMRCSGTVEDIVSYLNDPRLIEAEAMNLLLLSPIYKTMEKHIETTLPEDISHANMQIGLLFCVVMISNLLTTLCWMGWLENFLEKSLYNTRMLLFRLPHQVLEHAEPILDYLRLSASVNL